MDDVPQTDLVAAALSGKQEAFGALAQRSRNDMVRLATRLLGDEHAAEDAVQEALVKAYHRLMSLKEPAKFTAWMNAILINECRQYWRRESALILPLPEDIWPMGARDAGETNLGGMLAATAMAILALPERQCLAANWSWFCGASASDIAESLETSDTAIHSLLQRARVALRTAYDNICEKGDLIMENTVNDLELVATPMLLIERLRLGEPCWSMNQFTASATNRSEHPLYLTLDIRSAVPGHEGGWEKGLFYELGPGEQRQLEEEYYMKRILSPWYAVFRGPSVGRVRVTIALLSKEEFQKRTTFHQVPDKMIFQKWFDLLIPADPGEHGIPVKPVLPQADDVTLEAATPDGFSVGEHALALQLHNHATETRRIYVHVDTPGWGNGEEFDVPPAEIVDLSFRYAINANWRSYPSNSSYHLTLQVLQLPLNFDALDIEGERAFCRWRYGDSVPEAIVTAKTFAME